MAAHPIKLMGPGHLPLIPSFNDFNSMAEEDFIEDLQETLSQLKGVQVVKVEVMSPPVVKDEDPWRSVFNPGWNPKIDSGSGSYHDTVMDRKSEPTTWDMILKSESMKKRDAGAAPSERNDSLMSADDLRSKLSDPSTIEELIQMSGKPDDQVDVGAFASLLRSHRSDTRQIKDQ